MVVTSSVRDLRQAANLVSLRLREIKPELFASIWRVALLNLFRYAALQRI